MLITRARRGPGQRLHWACGHVPPRVHGKLISDYQVYLRADLVFVSDRFDYTRVVIDGRRGW